MSHSVPRHLKLEIEAYDETIRRWIPGYEDMLDAAASAVASVQPDHVVDLGAGTGGLSRALLDRAEVGRVELLDVDPDMLEHARVRLEEFGNRVWFTLRSYDEPFERADAFAASLALHHIPTLEKKTAFFARAFQALRPGGVLVNADANMPADPTEQKRLYRHWADHQIAHGISEERAYANFAEWADEDTYLPLDDELAALRRVGFDARCVWTDGPMGVVVARKPLS
jgi:tRNA (cmo5U34)-methyltransferase